VASYTDLDYSSLRVRLLALATSAFPDVAWDAEAALETLLLELNAHVGGVVVKYLLNVGRESRWGTALQRRSLLQLVKLIGYKPPGARAARFAVTLSLASSPVATVTVPAGAVCKTIQVNGVAPIVYQTLEDVTFLAGQTSKSTTVEQSESRSESFVSTSLARQTITLTQTPYLDGSAEVTAADGAYSEVDNFLASTATSRHFTTQVDDLDRVTVIFGDGINGAIPSGTITVDYKTGGGTAGNVAAGKITQIEGSFTDANGTPVVVAVTNPATATIKGVDRVSASQIRELAPLSIRVLTRAVAREDFEIGALEVQGVARALHLTSNEEPGIGENEGRIFLVPDDGGTASSQLVSDVLAQFTSTGPYPCLQTFLLSAQTASYLTIGVLAKVYLRKGYTGATVAADIRSRLTDHFALRITPARLWELAPELAKRLSVSARDTLSTIRNPLVDFGYAIQDVDGEPAGSYAWSDLFDLVRDTSGVLKVSPDGEGLLLNGVRADVPMGSYQFPKLGTVTLINATTGETL